MDYALYAFSIDNRFLKAYMAYEQTKKEPRMSRNDDWIEWNGGECPVDPDVLVECWLCDDSEEEAAASIQLAASYWRWQHKGDDDDIIKYRIVREAAQ